MNTEIKLLSGALGAEIKGVDLTDISDENFKKINDLLLEHKVIFFRNQPITKDQQVALAEKFGPLETHAYVKGLDCLLYTSPSPRDMRRSRMPSSA